MDIIGFFDHEDAELPKKRDDEDYEVFLRGILDAYLALVGKLSGKDRVSTSIRQAAGEIQQLSDHLCESLKAYFDGSTHAAFGEFQKGLRIIDERLRKLVSPDVSQHLQHLYRVRLDSLRAFERRDLFHIPFDKRHKVSTKRYSIPGLPCLYLSGSLWACWEELDRPSFDIMHVSRFCAAAPIHVLDFGYRPALIAAMLDHHKEKILGNRPKGQLYAEFAINQAVCWPLIAACAIEVRHRGSAFVPEYVISQQLLQWLMTCEEYDGLRYFSTRISQYTDNPVVAMNYVFPIRSRQSDGYCDRLRGKFEVTQPLAWTMLSRSYLPGSHTNNPTWKLELAEGVTVPYLHTEFHDCECKLAELDTHAI